MITPEKKAACHSILDACTRQPVAAFFRHNRGRFSTIGPNSDKSNRNTLHLIQKKCPATSALSAAVLGSPAPLRPAKCRPCWRRQRRRPRRRLDRRAATWAAWSARCPALSMHSSIGQTMTCAARACCGPMRRASGCVFRARSAGERLAIIIALPTLDAGATGEGFDSNVTITVEDSGRFFSTPNLDTCWTDVTTNEPLPDTEGTLQCCRQSFLCWPAGRNSTGTRFVDVRDLRFSGVLPTGASNESLRRLSVLALAGCSPQPATLTGNHAGTGQCLRFQPGSRSSMTRGNAFDSMSTWRKPASNGGGG